MMPASAAIAGQAIRLIASAAAPVRVERAYLMGIVLDLGGSGFARLHLPIPDYHSQHWRAASIRRPAANFRDFAAVWLGHYFVGHVTNQRRSAKIGE
jgi:hypothetical protein